MKHILILILITISFCSCSRTYHCVCTNPGGNNTVFSTTSNRKEAIKSCNKYYQDNFGSIPWNETFCEIK